MWFYSSVCDKRWGEMNKDRDKERGGERLKKRIKRACMKRRIEAVETNKERL